MDLVQLFFENSSKIADLGTVFALSLSLSLNTIVLITFLHFSQKIVGYSTCMNILAFLFVGGFTQKETVYEKECILGFNDVDAGNRFCACQL
jgi:hypothetical protein